MDMHTHFLRDDTRIMTFVNMRNAVGKAGWNKELGSREQTIEDLKFNNYKKEMFLDSDTKISLISSAPSDVEQDWFLTNEQMAEARARRSTTRPLAPGISHMIFTPDSRAGWKNSTPASPEAGILQGLHVGDNTPTRRSAAIPGGWTTRRWPYKGYEEDGKGRLKNVCVTRPVRAGIEKQ